MPHGFSINELLPPWITRIRPYPPGKPVEEVERELGHTAIKLASNENPLGPSPKALEALRNSLDRANFYPDGAGYYLRRKLAEFQQLDMSQIILGAGSTDLIELAAKTFLTASDQAITSQSAFYIYRLAIEEMGAELVQTPLRDNAFDLGAIAHSVTQRTKIIYIANPNNPTGRMVGVDDMDRFLESLPARVLVVLDEAYYEYVRDPDYSHSLDHVRQGRNVLVLRTFSKVYGLAGLRLGYGIGNAELIEALNRVRSPFNVNSLAHAAWRLSMTRTTWRVRWNRIHVK
jgi:histidinol-phosphate aminotransferase